MEFAVLGAHAASAARAENEHLLCAILEDSSCTASRWLAALGIELPQAARECRQLSGQLVLPAQPRMAASRTGRPSDKYGRDLTRLAQEGRLDPVLCRDAELDRMIEILCRRQKNNPCLLGEPGVGKTAVADIKNLSLTGYQVIKYTLDESKYDGGAKNINSIPLIRYAEVLLNYAEAQAELGVLTDSEWALTVGALRKRAGITGGTETLPTTVDSYLQRTFYPDVTSPVLLEIRRERAIELVAEGMRFDDLRRWKCGSLMETLPWSGIHIPGLEQPVDVNGDGVNDYYFTEGEVASAPAAYKNIAVRVNQDGVGLYAEANPVSGYDLVYKTGAGDRYWYPDGRQYLYPIPAKVIRDYRNAGYTISQNPEWDNE